MVDTAIHARKDDRMDEHERIRLRHDGERPHHHKATQQRLVHQDLRQLTFEAAASSAGTEHDFARPHRYSEPRRADGKMAASATHLPLGVEELVGATLSALFSGWNGRNPALA
jgi:hypothetical protein